MKKKKIPFGWYLNNNSELVEVSAEDFLKELKRIKEELKEKGIEEKYITLDSYNLIKEEN